MAQQQQRVHGYVLKDLTKVLPQIAANHPYPKLVGDSARSREFATAVTSASFSFARWAARGSRHTMRLSEEHERRDER